MTASATIDPAASSPIIEARPDHGGARFLGDTQPFLRLLIRGGALLTVTLGIYRFWLVTDVRRFLWGGTEIAGDVLEYLGTARELLIGFLTAIAVLVPIYAAFLLAMLDLGLLGRITGVLAFAVLALLGQFAVFRARRYRLTRTLFRGLRFHQTGSAWRYAAYAVLWWTLIALTFGLAYPWAQAGLERYKMRNTFYGDLPGRFDGSGTRLFFRGLPMWFFIVAPMLVGLAMTVRALDWTALADAINRGGDDVMDRIEGTNPGFAAAIVLAAMAVGWSVAAAAALYPAFQGMVLRWWVSGLRFGEVAATSKLRTVSVYAAYMRFLWYAMLLSIAVVVASVLVALLAHYLGRLLGQREMAEMLGVAGSVGIYIVTAVAYSTIYQATVKLGLWRVGFESLDLTGLEALECVQAAGQVGSAIDEGLADALHVGGY